MTQHSNIEVDELMSHLRQAHRGRCVVVVLVAAVSLLALAPAVGAVPTLYGTYCAPNCPRVNITRSVAGSPSVFEPIGEMHFGAAEATNEPRVHPDEFMAAPTRSDRVLYIAERAKPSSLLVTSEGQTRAVTVPGWLWQATWLNDDTILAASSRKNLSFGEGLIDLWSVALDGAVTKIGTERRSSMNADLTAGGGTFVHSAKLRRASGAVKCSLPKGATVYRDGWNPQAGVFAARRDTMALTPAGDERHVVSLGTLNRQCRFRAAATVTYTTEGVGDTSAWQIGEAAANGGNSLARAVWAPNGRKAFAVADTSYLRSDLRYQRITIIDVANRRRTVIPATFATNANVSSGTEDSDGLLAWDADGLWLTAYRANPSKGMDLTVTDGAAGEDVSYGTWFLLEHLFTLSPTGKVIAKQHYVGNAANVCSPIEQPLLSCVYATTELLP